MDSTPKGPQPGRCRGRKSLWRVVWQGAQAKDMLSPWTCFLRGFFITNHRMSCAARDLSPQCQPQQAAMRSGTKACLSPHTTRRVGGCECVGLGQSCRDLGQLQLSRLGADNNFNPCLSVCPSGLSVSLDPYINGFNKKILLNASASCIRKMLFEVVHFSGSCD